MPQTVLSVTGMTAGLFFISQLNHGISQQLQSRTVMSSKLTEENKVPLNSKGTKLFYWVNVHFLKLTWGSFEIRKHVVCCLEGDPAGFAMENSL